MTHHPSERLGTKETMCCNEAAKGKGPDYGWALTVLAVGREVCTQLHQHTIFISAIMVQGGKILKGVNSHG